MMKWNTNSLLKIGFVVVAAGLALLAWRYFPQKPLGEGFASGNGRIEAVEIDIAAKIPGRVKDILVQEGDFVTAGQILAQMDTAVLESQRREAEAQLRQSHSAVERARSQVTQREAEKAAALALVTQRKTELDIARNRLRRSEPLLSEQAIAGLDVDEARAAVQNARAAVAAAEAQVAASQAAIITATSQVAEAESLIGVWQATIDRLQADIDDSALKAPRDGRVQYRVAQPGEVIPAGGKVLNMLDLSDVYMTFFLPTAAAGRLAMGSEIRLVLDAVPQYVIPANISFVAADAQFTPKTVETASEREKLMFRVKAKISPELLKKHIRKVKTGLPGMAYVRLHSQVEWPAELQVKLPP
jgi:HlyD family secretion protein